MDWLTGDMFTTERNIQKIKIGDLGAPLYLFANGMFGNVNNFFDIGTKQIFFILEIRKFAIDFGFLMSFVCVY
jgi:hypothetical protein